MRCLAVLRMNPYTGRDMHGLISLGSCTKVPMSYIALHLFSVESGVKNYFPVKEFLGSRAQRRKNNEGGEKINNSFLCGHQWGWSSGSPLLPQTPDRTEGRVDLQWT